MSEDDYSQIERDGGRHAVSARGRASKSNDAGRYEASHRERVDDGWADEDESPVQHETTLTVDHSRGIISSNRSPDLHFNKTISPYRGCEHGCIYCFARPTHAYLGLSPGLDFETKLFFKPDAAELLEKEFRKPSYQVERIQLGAVTDAYQPVEKKLEITRRVLEVLAEFNHPVGITTKNAMVTRDIDILSRLSEANLVVVALSITTLDHKLARAMEPRASTPRRRLEAIKTLSSAGIPVAVGVSPIIPGLTDHEIENVMELAAESGAKSAFYNMLRLPLEISQLFQEWLAAERPERASRVMSLVRQTRGGKDYDSRFGSRMVGEGPIAELIARRFELARRRLGLAEQITDLDGTRFKIPPRAGDQLTLF
ncbi:MAG: PA0069 family radical SAM protein [Rhizobiaceae bacterium]|nr:PA0069 family radical SAM protein [Rhizobiaceae bacterium]